MTAAGILATLPRAQAKAQGLKRYFTGKQCPRGHIADRYTSTGNCTACTEDHNRDPRQILARKQLGQKPEALKASKLRSKRYHSENRPAVLEKMKARNKAFYEKNSEEIKAAVLAYQAANGPERNAYKSAWQAAKKKSDPQFAALLTMRKLVARMCERIKASRKEQGRTTQVLGYSAIQFRDHIARQFLPGMTWANHGEWHVDHIYPLSGFDLSQPSERAAANSLGNLRPLWAIDNMKKSDEVQSLL